MDKRSKWLMIGVGLLAGAWILDQVVYSPWKQKWEKLGADLTKTRASLRAAKDVVAKEESVRAEWKKVKAPLDKPERAGIETDFMFVVGGLASNADARPGLDQRNAEQAGDFKEVIVDAHLTCTVDGLTKFLLAVYNSKEFLKLRRLHIGSQYDRPEEKMTVDVKLSTIVYAPKPNTK